MSGAALIRPLKLAATLFTLAVAAACGGGDSGTTNPGGGGGGGTPAISIALSSSTADVQQGASTNVTVTLTRSGGFTGGVTLAVDGLPAGVTVNTAAIGSSQTSATLTLTASQSATVGNASLTIRASGSGVATATASLALTVRAATPPAGSFTLTASPTTVSLAQGATATVTIAVARTGSFTGPVGLTATGAPAGLTATLSPTSVTGSSATLTLAAAASLATGSQTLTIRGTGTGASDQTITLPVNITAAGGGSNGNVAWKFCGTSGIPIWVAAQDGTGPWTRVTGSNDTYSFNVTTRGGIAYVLQNTDGYSLEVFYGTAQELAARGPQLCNGATGTGSTITAPLANVGATDVILAALGPSIGRATLTGSPILTFQNVPSGTLDFVASKSTLSLVGNTPSFALGKMIIRRGLTPTAESALATVDFNGSEAFTPVTRNLTIGNLGGDVSVLAGAYSTANNTIAPYLTDISGVTGGTRTYQGVPAANQAAGDLHVLTVSAFPSLTQTTQTRTVTAVFKDAVDRTVTLGPTLNAPTVTSLPAVGYGRVRAAITTQTEYSRYFSFDIAQSGASSRQVDILQTGAYASGSTINLDVPDFSGVVGFDANWGLKAGTQATWSLAATGWSGTGVVAPSFADGATYFSATRQGNVTP